MEIFCRYTLTGFKPLSPTDHDNMKSCKLKIGEDYLLAIVKPRNIKFHRKYMAMINLVYDNLPEGMNYPTADLLRKDLQIKAGYFQEFVDMDGSVRKESLSISFAKMDDIAFEKLYNDVIDVVIKHVLPISKEELESEINEFL